MKENLRSKSSYTRRPELSLNPMGLGSRGQSTNNFLVNTSIQKQKSKVILNLETAIRENFKKVIKQRKHNRSIDGISSKRKIDIFNLKNSKNLEKLSQANPGCLTDRNKGKFDIDSVVKHSEKDLKGKNFNLKLSKNNLKKFRSLKNQNRDVRKSSYESSTLLKPKIMNDSQIPKIFRKVRKEVPILKIESDQKWQQYSVK